MNVDKAGADDSVSSINYLLTLLLTQISNSDNPVTDNTNISNKTNEKKGVEADRITNAEKARPFLRAIKTRTATQNPKMPSSGKQ